MTDNAKAAENPDGTGNAKPAPKPAVKAEKPVTVAVLQDKGELTVKPGHFIVTCRYPGMRRAGIEHPALKVWPAGSLSTAQLAAIRKDDDMLIVEVR